MKIKNTKYFIVTSLIAISTLIVFNSLSIDWVTKFDPDLKMPGSFQALQFWNQVRAYPNEEISSDAFIIAHNYSNQNVLRRTGIENTTDPWKAIGPHNTGGRTNALAFNPQNPNTLYAGSASGGLWRSYSAGVGVDAWHYVPVGFPIMGISSIAFAPGDSNTIYIGTGEVYSYSGVGTGAAYRSMRGTYGIGILKSTDGGQTWEKSLDWSYQSQRGVWAVKVNPLNPNTVWAVTTEGVYKSYNAGLSWQQMNNVIMGTDLIINSVDTNIVISGHGNFASAGFGIYRTTDGGSNWNHITSGLPGYYEGKIQLDIYNADPNIVYASIGHGFSTSGYNASWLCKSTDAGLNWIQVNTTDYSKWQGWFSHDVAINPSNPDDITIIGIEVWRSTNGGTTLTQKSVGGVTLGRPPIGGPEGSDSYVHSDIHDVIYHPTDNNKIYFGCDGGVFRSTDGGETFAGINGRYQTVQFYNGTSSSQTDSLKSFGGLQDNGSVIYDGDLAWIRVIGGDGSWTAIDAQDDSKMFGSSQFLNIGRSTNSGSSFSGITPPGGSNPTAFIAPYKLFYGNGNIIYAGRSVIYKSTNAGTNWNATNSGNALDGNFAFAMDLSYQNDDKVFVATAPFTTLRSHVFRTENGGTNWIDITGILPDRFPADIAVDPLEDNILYITFYGFGTSHIYKSTNSGDTWTDVNDNLPDIPAPSVIVDPNNTNHIYVGTDLGVYVSTNGGGNWQDFNDGLPDNAVQVMDLNLTITNNVIRVMSHGNGAFERKLLSTIVTNSGNNNGIISDFKLMQNYPNPFNPSTIIRWQSPASSHQSLRIYDVLGNEVATLVDEFRSAGEYEVEFNSSGLPSGTYFYKLTSGKFSATKKMLLLK